MDAGLMDAEALRRAIMGLRPCVVFHDIGPEVLAQIRAAAQPQPPAARIEVHPYYLERIDWGALEDSNKARQQLQDFLDEQIAAWVRARAFEAYAAQREVYRNVDCT